MEAREKHRQRLLSAHPPHTKTGVGGTRRRPTERRGPSEECGAWDGGGGLCGSLQSDINTDALKTGRGGVCSFLSSHPHLTSYIQTANKIAKRRKILPRSSAACILWATLANILQNSASLFQNPPRSQRSLMLSIYRWEIGLYRNLHADQIGMH